MFDKYKRDQKRWTPADFGLIILMILTVILGSLAMAWGQDQIDGHRFERAREMATPLVIVRPPEVGVGDTAAIYFSDLYSSLIPLDVGAYHPITVYGETFEACAVEQTAGATILTVNRDDARARCGLHTANQD